jgi:hypothetical protein
VAVLAAPSGEPLRLVRVGAFVGLAALVWAALFLLYERYPYIRVGADLVAAAKKQTLATSTLFSPQDRIRVLVLGNSKALAGFNPAEFARVAGPGAAAVNLGLPADSEFLPILETALKAGNRPTHVLIQVGWADDRRPPGWFQRLLDDNATVYALVPFRDLPRDIVTFTIANRGGLAEGYSHSREQVAQMLRDRGWYYIEGQKLTPSGALPPDYQLPTDTPQTVYRRGLSTSAWRYRQLERLSAAYGFKVVLTPPVFRTHELAPPPAARAAAGTTALGGEYLLYPPQLFSDPVHLNPLGARTYTDHLARLFLAAR